MFHMTNVFKDVKMQSIIFNWNTLEHKMPINKEIVTPWIYNQALNEVSTNFNHIIVDTCHNIKIIW